MKNLRNIAVIAHVDHGKTTLVDALLKQTNTFRENQEEMGFERILDSNDQERERGITITAKNCAITYKGIKINIIDTPGHADFSGEVERTLGMADGALLVVDAQEGPMPQTTFVLRKAFELGLKIIVVINKIDKQYARPEWVEQKTEDLFLDLVSDPEQINFPVLYAVAREGKVFENLPADFTQDGSVAPLLDKIVEYFPAPQDNDTKSFKMLVSSFYADNHLGRVLVGNIHQGRVSVGQKVTLIQTPNSSFTVQKLFVADGLVQSEVESAGSGEIVSLAGVDGAKIGDTIAQIGETQGLESIKIEEPTLHIGIGPNTSPLAGREGKFSTSRLLEERLKKEIETNLSLKLKKRDDGKFEVAGRGELHLTVFLEDLRREGFEFEVEKPQVVTKLVDGVVCEPIEEVNIVVPNEYVGVINQELGKRYATLLTTEPINDRETGFVYNMPTRAIIGLRGIIVVATKGTAVINSRVIDYQPTGKAIPTKRTGVIVASEAGVALTYGLRAAEERGVLFIEPGTQVYEGMIVGKSPKEQDIAMNVVKNKKLTAVRSHNYNDIFSLAAPTLVTLEKGLDLIESDELMEVTPQNIRLRKRLLKEAERVRLQRKAKTN